MNQSTAAAAEASERTSSVSFIDRFPAVIEALGAPPPQMRPVQILMCAHRKSRHLGVRFSDNEPDVARHATSDDDAVLISGEPEARDIGARDRIAGDFLISHPHDWSRRVYWNSTTKAPIRMVRMAIHMSESQMNKMLRVIAAVKGRSSVV
jgi:hypothetical protein